MSLLVVGSIAFDTVHTPAETRERQLGGSATYFSVSASNFADVHMVGVVGQDFGQDNVDFLKSKGINTEGIEVADGETFHWEGRYGDNPNDRDTLNTCLNVFETFQPKLPSHAKEIEYLFLANIDPALQLQVLDQMTNLKFCACDTMNLWIDIARDKVVELISKVDAIILNDSEAQQLTSENNLVKAAEAIIAMGTTTVVIKKGEHGCVFFRDGSYFTAGAYPLADVRDPTGAGDTFAGGFMGHIAKSGNTDEDTMRKAIIYGSSLASFCCEDFGLGRLKTVTADEVEKRFEEFRRMSMF
ncbi:PfkB family carbohydrate kinase [Candidatus Hydrogenedentota bacterium]